MQSAIIAAIYAIAIGFVSLVAVDFALGLPDALQREPIVETVAIAPSATALLEATAPTAKPPFRQMSVQRQRDWARNNGIPIPRTVRTKTQITAYLEQFAV